MWTESISRSSLDLFGSAYHDWDKQQVAKESQGLAESVRDRCLRDVKQHLAPPPDAWVWVVCETRSAKRKEEHVWEELSNHFYFKNSRDVVAFLKHNWFLVDVLFEVRKQFDKYFGADTRSRLEVFTDPDDNNSNPKLFALVVSTLPSNDASTRLGRFDEEWWFDQPSKVRRVLSIDVDYIDGV